MAEDGERESLEHLTQDQLEKVRIITEDPRAGGRPDLRLCRNNYLMGSLELWSLTEAALLAGFGYKREYVGEQARKQAEPVVEKAVEEFASTHPHLDPRQ
jgi:hypothetical protein